MADINDCVNMMKLHKNPKGYSSDALCRQQFKTLECEHECNICGYYADYDYELNAFVDCDVKDETTDDLFRQYFKLNCECNKDR